MPPRKKAANKNPTTDSLPAAKAKAPPRKQVVTDDAIGYERPTTRKKNQDAHPGEIHNRYTTKRRTAEEIEHDLSAKIQAQLLAKEEVMRRNKERIDAIATLESSSRAGYQAKESSATRPDLYMVASHDDVEMDLEMEEDINSSGDREHSEPLSIPNELDEWDNDLRPGEDDEDYVPPASHQDSDSEEATFAGRDDTYELSDDPDGEDSFKQVPIKKKNGMSKVEARASFRAIVSERVRRDGLMAMEDVADTGSKTAQGKRKMSLDSADDGDAEGTSTTKRNRSVQLPVGALRAGWKAVASGGKAAKPRGVGNNSQARATVPTNVNDHDGDEEPFDACSPAKAKVLELAAHIDATQAPRASPSLTGGLVPKPGSARLSAAHASVSQKAIGVASAVRSTSQMGIALSVAKPKTQSSTNSNTKQVKKEPYTTASLPFDRDHAAADTKVWQGRILPLMFNWAGSLRKPFSANSHPQFETVIMDLWRQNLPHVGDKAEHEAIRDVAGTALRTWRSSFGKTALKVIREYFAGLGKEEIEEEVKGLLLHIKDGSSRFLYKYPDEKEGYRAAWLNPLILATFACHINRTIKSKEDESTYPIGALALTAVAVERALGNWRAGVEENNQFSDNEWGGKAARYVRSTMNISSEKWKEIMVAVSPYVKKRGSAAAEDDDSDEENEHLYVTDSRANIRD